MGTASGAGLSRKAENIFSGYKIGANAGKVGVGGFNMITASDSVQGNTGCNDRWRRRQARLEAHGGASRMGVLDGVRVSVGEGASPPTGVIASRVGVLDGVRVSVGEGASPPTGVIASRVGILDGVSVSVGEGVSPPTGVIASRVGILDGVSVSVGEGGSPPAGVITTRVGTLDGVSVSAGEGVLPPTGVTASRVGILGGVSVTQRRRWTVSEAEAEPGVLWKFRHQLQRAVSHTSIAGGGNDEVKWAERTSFVFIQ